MWGLFSALQFSVALAWVKRSVVDLGFILLGYDAVVIGNSLPTYWRIQQAPPKVGNKLSQNTASYPRRV